MATAVTQCRALLLKQLTLQSRQKKTLACQIVFPVIVILALWGINMLLSNLLGKLPSQKQDFIYGRTDISADMQLQYRTIRDDNYFPKSFYVTKDDTLLDDFGTLLRNGQGKGFLGNVQQFSGYLNGNYSQQIWMPYAIPAQKDAIDDLLFAINSENETVTNWKDGLLGSIHLKELQTDVAPYHVKYVVQSPNDMLMRNELTTSVFGMFPYRYFGDECKYAFRTTMISWLNSAFFKTIFNGAINVRATINEMPQRVGGINISQLLMDQSASVFFFVFLFPLPMIMFTIVYEKTERIREMMKLSGLKMRYYWIVTFVFNFILYLLFTAVLTYALAAALQYKWALRTNVLVIAIYYLSAALCIIGTGFFLAAFCGSTLLALVLGYIIALFAPQLTGALDQFVLQKTGDSLILILLIPPMAINHAFQSGILKMCTEGSCAGFSTLIGWNPVTKGILFMIIDGILFLILGLYFDAVLQGKWGVARSPLFCFDPIMRMIKKKRKKSVTTEERATLITVREDDGDLQDEDVMQEAERVSRMVNNPDEEVQPIVIDHMRKSYGAKVAVDDLSFSVGKKKCFGLLGPNGAGKTTLISVLCGLLPPTSGTALINGYDIRYDMPQVHQSMGLCPQHDIVWGDLTVEEHLLFYARIKGVSRRDEKEVVKSALESVGLNDLTDNSKSSQLSGGMRKRLAIAISLVANPSIVLLDEPTTGLDPTSRRQIWDILSRTKEKHSLILTTHSLEEADVLSDSIGIMSKGQLKCIGTSMHLKNKFGSGYRLSVNYATKDEEQVEGYIREITGNRCVINSRFAGNLVFDLPKSMFAESSISNFMTKLEDGKQQVGINDWAFAQTTLEDVFMNIIREDEGVEN